MNQSNDFPYPEWQIPAQGVFLETDPAKLHEKIQSAEIKIFERLRQIQRSSDGYHEQNAINRALSLIRTIRLERLGTQRRGKTSGRLGGIMPQNEWRALYRHAVLETDFGQLLERAIKGERVYITRHEAPKAVLISVDDFQALSAYATTKLDSLSGEFDALLARMQAPGARAAMKAAFDASPEQLGTAAVEAAGDRD